MKRLLALPLLLPLVGCEALGAWLNAPASDPLVYTDPDTGVTVEGELPIPPKPVVVEHTDPETGATVRVTENQAPPETRGDIIATAAGRWAGTLTGNPLIGLLVGAAAAAGSRRLKKKKAHA